jgi:hypothetical protein
MRANECRIGDALAVVGDERQLTLRRLHRHRPLLAIGKPRHLQLHLCLGDEGTDFRQAEAGAEAIQRDHAKLQKDDVKCNGALLPAWCQQAKDQ